MESINCNICFESIDTSKIESHVNEENHILHKNELLTKMKLQKVEKNKTTRGVVDYWKTHKSKNIAFDSKGKYFKSG